MACLGRGSDGPTGNQWASPGEEQVQTQTGTGEKTTSTIRLELPLGNGTQIAGSALILEVLSAQGVLCPDHRGSKSALIVGTLEPACRTSGQRRATQRLPCGETQQLLV